MWLLCVVIVVTIRCCFCGCQDKFLIMAMEVSESVENAADVSSRWKVRPAENLYMEHRSVSGGHTIQLVALKEGKKTSPP